jgi:cytoskeleton protein RodZ
MSDWGNSSSEAAGSQADGTLDPAGSAGASAGSLLKTARESQGLHIAALAVSLKVPVKKIEALEADRYGELPDAVFVRALAASVCRALKVDATEILQKLPQTNKPFLSRNGQGINTPFRMPADGPGPINLKALLQRPISWAVMGLLLAALVLAVVPDIVQKISEMGSQLVSGMKGATAPAMPESTANAVDGVNGTVMGAGSAVTSSAEALALKTTASALSPTVASPTLVISPTLGGAAGAGTDTDGLVQFIAQGESWIEVSDARGKTTFKRVLQAGESAGASGALPLQVTVGSADQTQVLVRGKPLEGGKVRNNVLRFEVR